MDGMIDHPLAERFARPDFASLYLDFDSFFASAEQHFNPALRGKPIAVVPLDVPHTACIAISREAKALSVPSGARVAKAKAIAPDLTFVVARPDAYVRLHHDVLATIGACASVEKVRSIDELVCELPLIETRDAEAQARAIACKIKCSLAEKFSPVLTCSIGIAQTELLAKIAAEMHKPDGLTVMRAADLPAAIAHLPLSDLPGVSDGIQARLNRAGIDSVEALWNLSPRRARRVWGSIEGERLWNALHGMPYTRAETEKRMFGHSRMLPGDWRTPEKVEQCARQLALSAARRLRRSDKRATKVTLAAKGGDNRALYSKRKTRTPDHLRWSHEVRCRGARDDKTVLRSLSQAIAAYREQVRFRPRSVSVTLHGLKAADPAQADLFAHSASAALDTDQRRSERLSATLDAIRHDHGPDAAQLGMALAVPGGYLGGKIAFGRIPELSDFGESLSQDHETRFCESI
ncbi:MAG: type VI secretion protein ImpB [Pseudomonadota bacterium]